MTTASAMTPTAPAMTITIITTPMRCSPPGVRKHPRCIRRRISTCGCHDHDHHHHDHDADEVFTSWGKETPHKYTKEKIESILKIFCDTEDYGSILRAKGMVPAEDGTWIYFDMVPGEYELRDGEPDYTGRLCVIGTNIDEHKLEELFELN